MRKNLKSSDNKIGFSFVGISLNNVVLRESTPVDEFYILDGVSARTNQKHIAFTDPIRMIFNQKRLNSIGASQVNAWLDSLVQHKKDPLAELRSKCTDAELKQLIKSRHIQQPCEVVAWAQMMTENMETFKSEVVKLAAEQQAQQQVTETKVETSKTE